MWANGRRQPAVHHFACTPWQVHELRRDEIELARGRIPGQDVGLLPADPVYDLLAAAGCAFRGTLQRNCRDIVDAEKARAYIVPTMQ